MGKRCYEQGKFSYKCLGVELKISKQENTENQKQKKKNQLNFTATYSKEYSCRVLGQKDYRS